MNKELFIGAIDLSPYFSECKKVRGGLEIRLKAVPWTLWLEFSQYYQGAYDRNLSIKTPLYIMWRNWEYYLEIHSLYQLYEGWGKGRYCIAAHVDDRIIYIKFEPIIPIIEA